MYFFLPWFICKYHKSKSTRKIKQVNMHICFKTSSHTLSKGLRILPTPLNLISHHPRHHLTISNSFSFISNHFPKLLQEIPIILQDIIELIKRHESKILFVYKNIKGIKGFPMLIHFISFSHPSFFPSLSIIFYPQ